MEDQVVLLGGGGHAAVVLDCLVACGCRTVGFFDDNPMAFLGELAHLGKYKHHTLPYARLIVAIGNNHTRRRQTGAVSHSYAVALHPSALVSPSAILGEGTVVFHGAIIQARSAVGKHVIINTGAQVDHDNHISDFAHIGPGAVLCGNVTVGEGVLIGAGAVVMPGITLGDWAIVAAGAVVARDVAAGVTVKGVPAR